MGDHHPEKQRNQRGGGSVADNLVEPERREREGQEMGRQMQRTPAVATAQAG